MLTFSVRPLQISFARATGRVLIYIPDVKVRVAFNAKTVSAQYLEKFMSDSHGTW